MTTLIKGRSNYYLLTNQSGSTRSAGEAVIVDTAHDEAFTTSTTAADLRALGVVVDASILDTATGYVQIVGSVMPLVKTVGTVVRGHYVYQSGTAGKVADSGTLASATAAAPAGSIGIAMTGVVGAGTITVYLFAAKAAALTNTKYDVDTKPASANAMDDEFDDTTNNSGSGNGLDAQWSTRNSPTITYPQNGLIKIAVPSAQATNNVRIIEQTLPVAPWSFAAKVSLAGQAVDFVTGGLCLVDGTNGDFYALSIGLRTVSGNVRYFLNTAKFTNVTTNSGADPLTFEIASDGAMYLRADMTGTTISFYLSNDGIAWVLMGSFADAVNITKVGLMVNESNNKGDSALFVRWFRRLA